MKRLVAALAAIIVAGAAALVLAQGKNTKPLEIWVVDVEGGKAALYVSPTGQTALIDTGFPGARDLDRIMAAIADAGVKQIDYLISTHYHVDHIGGLTELAKRIPIGTFVDHGPTVEGPDVTQIRAGPGRAHPDEAARADRGFPGGVCRAVQQSEAHRRPAGGPRADHGSRVANRDRGRQRAEDSAAGGGRPNPHCANFTPLPTNEGMVDPDDFHSVGSVIILGQFRAVDFGDMWRTKELELVCPNNPIGAVDLYFASSHGAIASGSRPFVHGLQPRVALVQNGTRKGAAAGPMTTIFSSPGLEGVWQMHWSYNGLVEQNTTGAAHREHRGHADDRRRVDRAAARRRSGSRRGRNGSAGSRCCASGDRRCAANGRGTSVSGASGVPRRRKDLAPAHRPPALRHPAVAEAMPQDTRPRTGSGSRRSRTGASRSRTRGTGSARPTGRAYPRARLGNSWTVSAESVVPARSRVARVSLPIVYMHHVSY